MHITVEKIRNPLTGHLIKIDGPVYRRALKNGARFNTATKVSVHVPHKRQPKVDSNMNRKLIAAHDIVQRESKGAKGWNKAASRKGTQRNMLKKKCGQECLLSGDKYPVCDKKCRIDCRGLLAAFIRSRQHKHKQVAKASKSLAQSVGCRWTRSKSKSKSRSRSSK